LAGDRYEQERAMYAAYTEASLQAMKNLRSTAHFGWFVVPLLAFVIYAYFVEVERGNWKMFLAGIFFWGVELGWEMFNALILHFTKRSALWTTPGDSAYIMFVGLTVEISMMFAVAGLIFCKTLPADRKARVWGVPNRILAIISFGVLCVAVESVLNAWGALVWEYPFWRWPNVWLIILAYCVGFAVCALFYDWDRPTKWKVGLTAAVYGLDLLAIILFVWALKWI
jgi:hypothetical protein